MPSWQLLLSANKLALLTCILSWLRVPQAAAQDAYQRFQAQGEGAASIATKGEGRGQPAGSPTVFSVILPSHSPQHVLPAGRTKPINPQTVIGYLADAAGSGAPALFIWALRIVIVAGSGMRGGCCSGLCE